MKYETSRRDQLLGRWGEWAARRWRAVLLIALGITVVMGIGISLVNAEFTFYSIMPNSSEKVRDLKTIVETFPAASAIVVVVQADLDRPPSTAAEFRSARNTVTHAIDEIVTTLASSDYGEYVSNVYGRTDLDFIRTHGLMLTNADTIARLERSTAELGLVPFFKALNDDLEQEYSGNEEGLANDEQIVIAEFEALGDMLAMLDQASAGNPPDNESIAAVVDRYLVGDGYLLNRDGTIGLLFVEPTFTMNDLGPLLDGVLSIDRAVKDRASDLGVTAGLTGLTVVAKDEGVTAEQGLAISTLIAIVLILGLMIVSFRMLSSPILVGVPLVIGIVWTIGAAGYVLNRLNIVTAMYLVALLGIGVDYAIHLLTTFVQERDDGADFVHAVGLAFEKSGSGILLGALTTAVAFFALLVGQSELVRELGSVAGIGVLAELLAMFLIIPGLLGLRNHRNEKRGRGERRILARLPKKLVLLPRLGASIERAPAAFAIVVLLVGAALATQAFRVKIEGNIMNMEAKGLESVELQDLMVREFSMAPDYLSVTTSNLDELRVLADEIDKLSTVKMVDSIEPYLPSEQESAARAIEIERLDQSIRSAPVSSDVDVDQLAAEVDRLWFNIAELSDLAYFGEMDRLFQTLNTVVGLNADGDQVETTAIDRLPDELATADETSLREFQTAFAATYRSAILRMADPEPVTVGMLPGEIRDTYISADDNRYLLNAIPQQNPWDETFRRAYAGQLETVTDRATGMLLASDQMYQIARVDGVRAAVAALIVIFVLLMIDFRNLALSILTLLPLLLSFASLFGLMALVGIKFDFINIISVPLLIGIGVDDAVHINHRYLRERRISTVVERTGMALMLTSLTTIIGFASFIPSPMRAMRSTGIVLSVAMAFAFFYSVLFHPAVLRLMHERLGMRITPWGKKE